VTSKALQWARKQGLNCEQDIMAETLRQLCRLTTINSLILGCLFAITIILGIKL
jgi:hypothetical protein